MDEKGWDDQKEIRGNLTAEEEKTCAPL